jgi:hypothetical protein
MLLLFDMVILTTRFMKQCLALFEPCFSDFFARFVFFNLETNQPTAYTDRATMTDVFFAFVACFWSNFFLFSLPDSVSIT